MRLGRTAFLSGSSKGESISRDMLGCWHIQVRLVVELKIPIFLLSADNRYVLEAFLQSWIEHLKHSRAAPLQAVVTDNTAHNHTFSIGGATFRFGNLKTEVHFPTNKNNKVEGEKMAA